MTEYPYAAGDFLKWQLDDLQEVCKGNYDFFFWSQNGAFTAAKNGDVEFLGYTYMALHDFARDYYKNG